MAQKILSQAFVVTAAGGCAYLLYQYPPFIKSKDRETVQVLYQDKFGRGYFVEMQKNEAVNHTAAAARAQAKALLDDPVPPALRRYASVWRNYASGEKLDKARKELEKSVAALDEVFKSADLEEIEKRTTVVATGMRALHHAAGQTRLEASLAIKKIPTKTILAKTKLVRLGTPQTTTTAQQVWQDQTTHGAIALYFTASWCGPCKRFTPELSSAYRAAHSAHLPVEVIHVPWDTSAEDMNAYVSSQNLNWLAIPPSSRTVIEELSLKYDVTSIPTLFVVSGGGGATEGDHVIDPDGRTHVQMTGLAALQDWCRS